MAKIFELREQIDACRPGTADLSQAELADLALAVGRDPDVTHELSQSQALDREVRKALHDAPIPAGLAERLIAAIQVEAAPAVELAEKDVAETIGSRRHRFGRRHWWQAGAAVVLTVLLTAVALNLVLPQRDVVRDELAVDVTGWLSNLQANKWQQVTAAGLPKESALDPAVNGRALQWQAFTANGHSGWSGTVTAINLQKPNQPRAILFVVRSSSRFAVPAAPAAARPLALSRGFSATAWQRQQRGLLYVLVVEEDRGQRLEDFLRKPTQA